MENAQCTSISHAILWIAIYPNFIVGDWVSYSMTNILVLYHILQQESIDWIRQQYQVISLEELLCYGTPQLLL